MWADMSFQDAVPVEDARTIGRALNDAAALVIDLVNAAGRRG